MADLESGLTRRDMLKRGAILGGAVAWATPVVQLVGMRPALAQTPSDTCIDDNWADLVIFGVGGTSQGTRHDGLPIEFARSDPDNALGPPDGPFFSLGFKKSSPTTFFADGGVLVVRLALQAFGSQGADVVVVETTGAAPNYPEERARVEVSNSSTGPWVEVGVASNQTGGDTVKVGILATTTLDLPDGPIQYVRLTDISNPALFTSFPDADGFDVNAVGTGCPPA